MKLKRVYGYWSNRLGFVPHGEALFLLSIGVSLVTVDVEA